MKQKIRINFVDIDNTLCKGYFTEPYITQPDLLLRKITNVTPFPWTVDDELFKNRDAIYHFITGRYDHQEKVTMEWIRMHFGIPRFHVHVIGYTSYDNYVKDKASKVRELIVEAIDDHGNDMELHLYEDTQDVIDATLKGKNEVCDVPMEIHVVEDGEIQPSYTA